MIKSFLDSVGQIWSGWEIRFSVLLSLLLQIVLIVFGNRRKYGCSTWVGVVIWVAYMLSDSVATFSLGFISNIQKYSPPSADKSIQVSEGVMIFWAPFLLVHLGGPDTITAYSLEDNELWLRHLFGFLGQVVVVFYLLVLSWIRSSVNNDTFPLTFIVIPVFVSGVLKYGEKTWVLWSSSSGRFKRTPYPRELPPNAIDLLLTDVIPDSELLVTADWLFKMLKPICSKLLIPLDYYICSLRLLSHRSPEDAFKVIEIELGFLYDLFFSKVLVAHSPTGLILRSISLVCTLAAFLAFVIVVGIGKHKFSQDEIVITYVLVVGAICGEIYIIVMLIFSDRTLLRLKKQKKGIGNLLYQSISASPWASMKRKMWSGSMAQLNLISFCIGDKPAQYGGIQKFFGICESLEISRYKTWEKVTPELKEVIFANIKERCGSINSTSDFDTLLNSRGAYALQQKHRFLKWSVESLGLDQSIFSWHLATDFCYYSDRNNPNQAKISKSLSDYMLYLIVFRPFMLPTGNWEFEYGKRVDEARLWFGEDALLSRAHACQLFFQKNQNVVTGPDYVDERIKVAKPSFGPTDGYWVAKLLLELECNERWDVITGVWIEMLCYVANKCDWNYHIQELSRGGELLTHIRLLMVHLGITDHIEHTCLIDYWRENFPPPG